MFQRFITLFVALVSHRSHYQLTASSEIDLVDVRRGLLHSLWGPGSGCHPPGTGIGDGRDAVPDLAIQRPSGIRRIGVRLGIPAVEIADEPHAAGFRGGAEKIHAVTCSFRGVPPWRGRLDLFSTGCRIHLRGSRIRSERCGIDRPCAGRSPVWIESLLCWQSQRPWRGYCRQRNRARSEWTGFHTTGSRSGLSSALTLTTFTFPRMRVATSSRTESRI